MSKKMKELCKYLPERSFDHLEELLNLPQIMDMIISNSNSQIRETSSDLVSFLMNLVINFHGFTLDRSLLQRIVIYLYGGKALIIFVRKFNCLTKYK